jgi:ClpX C4-type zinc finger protein
MTIDPDLLDRARAAGAALADADRRALLARADYHTAVRRLHLAGGSLREIAQALAVSHQRVQQIVSAAGGSWWRRVWRTRRVTPDAVCTWCGRPPAEVAKLIAGPRVYICDRCVEAAERAAGGKPNGGFNRPTAGGSPGRCGFCAKKTGASRQLVTAAPGHVCTDCLRVCRGILEASEG